MTESLILIDGKKVKSESLQISLMNAKQLIVGNVIGFGFVVHLAANTATDISNALLEFAKVPGVTSVTTLMLRNT